MPEENQVNTLVYYMGDDAEIMLRGLALTANKKKQYASVKAGLDLFLVAKKNVIYERANFNRCVQQPEETANSFFITLF